MFTLEINSSTKNAHELMNSQDLSDLPYLKVQCWFRCCIPFIFFKSAVPLKMSLTEVGGAHLIHIMWTWSQTKPQTGPL